MRAGATRAGSPPTGNSLLLMRHGQSTWNALGLWQGWADPPLTTLGQRDAQACAGALQVFGFERVNVHEEPGGAIGHAELRYGPSMLMLGSVREGSQWPQEPGSSALYVVVEDPDAHHERAVAAGAEVTMGLVDQDYGSREYTARDPEGNLWSFGTYRGA